MASRRDTSAAAALFRFRRGYSQRRLRRHYTVGERARQDRDNNALIGVYRSDSPRRVHVIMDHKLI